MLAIIILNLCGYVAIGCMLCTYMYIHRYIIVIKDLAKLKHTNIYIATYICMHCTKWLASSIEKLTTSPGAGPEPAVWLVRFWPDHFY